MKTSNLFILSSAAILLAACTAFTNSPNGVPRGELVWPDLTVADDATHSHGTYANLENLDKMRPGLTRDQVYATLGVPQFPTAFRSTEWTYLFYFDNKDQPENVSSCFYKVLFDKHFITKNFYTKPLNQGAHCPATPAHVIDE